MTKTKLSEPKNMFEELLKTMVEINASDLHLIHNNPVCYRVDGDVIKTKTFIKGKDVFKLLIESKAINDYHINNFHEEKAANFAYTYSGIRFRGNLSQSRGEYTAVIRRLSDKVIPVDAIGLPDKVKEEINRSFGLILVTGPTGSGKTTTLTSLIDHINETRKTHITTSEDPIEFVHRPKKSIITQREVGMDTPDFASSMKDSLRRDPDIILIGEMRDLETIENACVASETGHLVFGTLHTNTAMSSIDRIVSVFPVMQQQNIRSQLATNIRMVVNQRLFPKIGGGRVPAYEVMFLNKEMRRAIRQDRLEDLEDLMEKYKDEGNILMKDSIQELKDKGIIDPDLVY
ncbi:type IV pilus twitching motility protein PilT [Bacillus sp. Brlt_9]|uniref:type IV pilus twitching motility protein PilT n=1 Tax=Bacillus sp. Brlt_9 TaxID=3110916 RepID=UPI003F7CCE57